MATTLSKKRSLENASSNGASPLKKRKVDKNEKESTPPLILDDDEDEKDASSKPSISRKPTLLPAPSTGTIAIKTREKKPGLAKVPSNLLAFNGLITAENEKSEAINSASKSKKSDKEENNDSDTNDEDKEEKEAECATDINRQKLVNEVKELLAPCSRKLIKSGAIKYCIWFDDDDDNNPCLWIAKIESVTFDESSDVTSMLATFPGYGVDTYWLPIIFKNNWLVYQFNKDILFKDIYSNLWHNENFKTCKPMLIESKEYLSEMSDDSDDDNDNDSGNDSDYINVPELESTKERTVKRRKRYKRRKNAYKRKKDRIKTKRKKAKKSPYSLPKSKKSYSVSTKYSHSNKRLQNLDDVDTSKIRFTPISRKHLIGAPDLTDIDAVDHQSIEILFSFDTTGSMSSCLDSVRTHLKRILNLLFRDIPKIRIGILAHGDYCDENVYYVMQWVDLTDDQQKLIKFVDEATATGGGDSPECYELVLHNASRQISWNKKCVNRSLVLIGDANPHELGQNNPYKLDWREKAKDCKSCGIKIYGIHCLGNIGSKNFYESISEMTGGLYLSLDKIQSFAGMMVALCHREKDLIAYDESKESEHYKEEKKKFELLCSSLESFSVLGLKEMLRFNAQKVSGTKTELIHRIADCQIYGCMPRCIQCGGGHLRVIYINGKKYGHGGNGRYFCPGYYDGDEYVACLWSGDQTKIKREKWKNIDDEKVESLSGDEKMTDNNDHNKNK